MNRRFDTAASGFTLLEIAVAIVLVTVVLVNVYTLLGQSSRALGQRNVTFDADTQARRVLERMEMALIGAEAGSLVSPTSSPFSNSELSYIEDFGQQDVDGDGVKEQLRSNPRTIAMTHANGNEITWTENPGTETERRVVWAKHVSDFCAGEIPNGIDDNGNGLVDETGLSFVRDGKSIRIILTMSRPDADGHVVERKLESVVTCRN